MNVEATDLDRHLSGLTAIQVASNAWEPQPQSSGLSFWSTRLRVVREMIAQALDEYQLL